MKKIISLFKRDYKDTRLVYDEVVPGAEWVIEGEGWGTEKFDGTACMVRDGKLYKRYDRKKAGDIYKPAPEGWEACQEPDEITGHWPGWLPVGNGPEDRWHREALANSTPKPDGTYELVGKNINRNPYGLPDHRLWLHGQCTFAFCSRTFEELKECFKYMAIEGIVWHHPDGRMVKIKRRDFGYQWPETENLKFSPFVTLMKKGDIKHDQSDQLSQANAKYILWGIREKENDKCKI